MVIGNGLMAKRFSDYLSDGRVVIYASGVSDSKSTNEADYQREISLLNNTISTFPGCLLVYFSTCSIYDPFLSDKPYIRHKLKVEDLLRHSGIDYLVFRVSNVAGPCGNPKTIFHFLAQSIQRGLPFNLWKQASRNMIDVDDVYLFVKYFIERQYKNAIINIAHPVSFNMHDIVETFEAYFHKKGNYIIIEAGSDFFIDTTLVQSVAEKAGVSFEGNYLYRLLEKYYPIK
jgi:nucleoside-diphosphate-sugar epimerase